LAAGSMFISVLLGGCSSNVPQPPPSRSPSPDLHLCSKTLFLGTSSVSAYLPDTYFHEEDG
jgi:hypothetical protein